MDTLNLDVEQQASVFRILAGLLHLGNVKFKEDESKGETENLAISNPEVLELAATLLQVDPNKLSHGIRSRLVKIAGEEFTKYNNADEAAASRDALLKATYDNTFGWLFGRINGELVGEGELFHYIGVLDVYGFEIFDTNHFEQLCINFANEKLQSHFNNHCFTLAQQEYQSEGVEVDLFKFIDNSTCIQLFEKRQTGILSLIDEQLRLPVRSDEQLLIRMHEVHEKHVNYVKPKINMSHFSIRHYAGDVQYQIKGFLEKNADKLENEMSDLMKSSACSIVKSLFILETAASVANDTLPNEIDQNKEPNSHRSSVKKVADMSIGKQFHNQLQELTRLLMMTNPHFIRCIKPNEQKYPNSFYHPSVLQQLKYLGLKDLIAIRQHGYPIWTPHAAFIERYTILNYKDPHPATKVGVEQMLTKLLGSVEDKSWDVGTTKVFMKNSVREELESQRTKIIASWVAQFQKFCRSKLAKARVEKIKKLRDQLLEEIKVVQEKSTGVEKLTELLFNAEELDAAFPSLKTAAVLIEQAEDKETCVGVLAQLSACECQDASMFKHMIDRAGKLNLLDTTCPELKKAKEVYERIKDTTLTRITPELVNIAINSGISELLTIATDLEGDNLPDQEMHNKLVTKMSQVRSSEQLQEQIRNSEINSSKRKTRRKTVMLMGRASENRGSAGPGFKDKKYQLHLYPDLRNPEEFSKGKIFKQKKTKKADRMLVFTDKPISKSLCKLPAALTKLAVTLFKTIQGFMGNRSYSFTEGLASTVVSQVLDQALLRDETYVQICKQVTENPDMESRLKGWHLMCLCVERFPPSNIMLPYLNHFFLRSEGEIEENKHEPVDFLVKPYAAYCLAVLAKTTEIYIKHKNCPKIKSVSVNHAANFRKRVMIPGTVRINTCDGSHLNCTMNPWLPAGEAVDMVCRELGIKDSHGFSIYEVKKERDVYITPKQCLLDFHAGTHVNEPDQSTPYFLLKQRLRRVKDSPGTSQDPVIQTLLYFQYIKDIAKGKYPFSPEGLIEVWAHHHKFMQQVKGTEPTTPPDMAYTSQSTGRADISLSLKALKVKDVAKIEEKASKITEEMSPAKVFAVASKQCPDFGNQMFDTQLDIGGGKKQHARLSISPTDFVMSSLAKDGKVVSASKFPLSLIEKFSSTGTMLVLSFQPPSSASTAKVRHYMMLTNEASGIKHLLRNLTTKEAMPNDLKGIMQWQMSDFPDLKVIKQKIKK